MKWPLSLLGVVLVGCASQTQVNEFQPGGPTADQVAAIERQVFMPAGAEPIRQYLRTYFPDGSRIVGQYRLSQTRGIRSQREPDLAIMDGGCGVVTVIFDTATSTVESVACNGVA